MSKGKGVHAGADGPAVVFGKKNLDYVPQAASKEGSVQGSVESAVSDFSSQEETVEYPPLEYPKAVIDSTLMLNSFWKMKNSSEVWD